MAILLVKSPCTLAIIARGAPLVLFVVADIGGCCQIFGIWENKLLRYPFWKIIFRLFGALINFPFLMAILPVKYPVTLNIITRGAPLVLIVFAGHGGCFQIFDIRDNRFLSYPFWKLICGLLWWVLTRAISLWPAVFLDMDLFYHTCDKLYLTWQMTLFQSHYHFHCNGSWNQPASKTCWLTGQWPQYMPSEVKVGIETFLCM